MNGEVVSLGVVCAGEFSDSIDVVRTEWVVLEGHLPDGREWSSPALPPNVLFDPSWELEIGDEVIIGGFPSRAQAIAHDPDLYKERHLVECFINKIKRFRRFATHYDKTAQAYMSMICITCMMV